MEENKINQTPEQSDAQPVEQAQEAVELQPQQSESAEPQAAKSEPAKPAPAAPKQGKKAKGSKLTFGKVFLAALLAGIVGSVMMLFVWVAIFSGMSSAMAPVKGSVPESAILKIDLAENLVDAPSKNPFAGFDFTTMTTSSELTIYKALRALEAAAGDERIKGIYINIGAGGAAELALIEELRNAIETFKESGKFVVAYNDVYNQGVYFLSSVADKVYMQPEGTFAWPGIALNTMFFKGLFDKLGVEVDILRPSACKFKSAVEPMFLTKMSDANRLQVQSMANNIWSLITEKVSASRGVSVEQLNQMADDLSVILPKEALENKMVDGLMYADQIEELFKNEYGIEKPEYISLADYASALVPDSKKLSAPKVAIVYASGDIVEGRGSDDQIYGYTFAKTLREVAEDDDVKAVVMRVNSPGGSALASDIIWREVELLKQKKPVIVSMGAYAASGGYYISAPADAIVADNLTLTGSIGVFGMIPNVGDALEDKLGVTFDGVSTNKHSDIGNVYKPLSDFEHQAFMRVVDKVYTRFTSLVAEGRNLTIERVLELAEGRVWTGSEAQQNGLVDTCGGLTAALAIAVDKSGLGENYQIVEVSDTPTGFAALLQSMNVKTFKNIALRSEFGKLYNEYKHIEDMLGKQGVYTFCPYIFRIE